MFIRAATAICLLATSACIAATEHDQPPALLGFIENLARAEPLEAAKLRTMLPNELVQISANESIGRIDYAARDISLADGSIGLLDFRQVGANSLTVIDVKNGCLRIEEIARRFALDASIVPNRSHAPTGVYRTAKTPWGSMSFELVGSSTCVATVVLNSGL